MSVAMPKRGIKDIKFRRRREAKTNYAKRLALVKSGIDRIVVRKSNRRIMGQVVRYDTRGDVVLYSTDSNELKAFGWASRANRPTAYLTGMLLGRKIKEKDKEYILDIGLNSPVKNSIPFVFAKGCIDNGIKIRSTINIDEGLYNFSLIAKYAKGLKERDERLFAKQFGSYSKEKISLEEMPRLFNEVKEKIKGVSSNKV